VLHRHSPAEMYRKHQRVRLVPLFSEIGRWLVTHNINIVKNFCFPVLQLTESGFERMCDRERQERPEYDYNWNVPPSQCCVPLR
jgi:hypothetical protein